MRLLFLNRSFWPDLEATGQLLTELCTDLSAPHEVTVVAGPSYHVPLAQRGLWHRDALGAVTILRTWGTRLPKERLLGRLLNLGSYYLLAGIGALRLPAPEVIVAETDPPLLGVLAAALKRRWGCRFIYYCQDIYPDVAEVTGAVRSQALLALSARANRLAYAHADAIVVLGEDMRRRLVRKGVPAAKVVVLPNWVDCDAVRPVATSALREQFGDRFVVMYSGNLGLAQPFATILDAAARLRDVPRVLFVFIGSGARRTWIEQRATTTDLPNVCFLPYQPKNQLAESLSAADLHLVPLSAGLAGCLVPSKVYGVLAAGRPFVAMMDAEADIAVLARESAVGYVAPPDDAPALERVVRHAVAHPEELRAMGLRGRALAEQRFHRALRTRQFADLVASLADGRVQRLCDR